MCSPAVRFLSDHDAPCPTCGYNLRSARSSSCPECATPFELTIAPTHTSSASWHALLLSVSLLAGVGVHRWFAEAASGFPSLFGPLPALALKWYALHYAVLLSPALLIILFLARRWVLRRSQLCRWGLAAILLMVFLLECVSLVR